MGDAEDELATPLPTPEQLGLGLAYEIKALRGVVDLEPVPNRRPERVVYARSPDGALWVRKMDMPPAERIAEALGYLVCRCVGVPIPDAAVAVDGERVHWLSKVVHPSEVWGPELMYQIYNLDDLGRLLAIDAVLHVPDRHGDNVLFEPSDEGWHLWAIDFDCARIGDPGWLLGSMEHEPLPLAAELPGLDVDVIAGPMRQCADYLAALNLSDARDLAGAACAAARVTGLKERLAEALVTRCSIAPSLVSEYTQLLRTQA